MFNKKFNIQQKPFNELNIFVPRSLLSNARNMAALTEREENEMLVYENRKVKINNFEVEDELPQPVFTFSSPPYREYDQCSTTSMNEIQTCLVVIDRTTSLLRLIIQEVDEVDKQGWHTIESCFELILQSLHNHG